MKILREENMWIIATKDRKKVLCGRGCTCELKEFSEISNSLIRVYRGKKKAASSLESGWVLQDLMTQQMKDGTLSKEDYEKCFESKECRYFRHKDALEIALEKVIDIVPVRIIMEEKVE